MEEKQKFKDKTFSTRRFSQFGYAAVLVLALVFAGWGAFTTISGAVIASGQVASSGGDYVIEHPKGGAMARLFAANGDRVAAGDILLCLDGRELRAEIAIGETEYFSLMARRNRLEAELAGIVSESGADRIEWDAELTEALENGDGAPRIALLGQEKLFEVRNAGRRNQLTQMQEQVNQTRQEIKGLQAHASAYRSQLRLVSQELDVVQDLYRKEAAVLTDVLKLERDKAIVEGELGNLSSKIAIARGRIAELELRMSQFSTDQVEEMEHEVREIQVRENSLREHLGSLLVEERELCLRAPQTGYIHNLSVSAESEVIEPGEPVAVIVPEKSKVYRACSAEHDRYRSDSAWPADCFAVFGIFGQRHAGIQRHGQLHLQRRRLQRGERISMVRYSRRSRRAGPSGRIRAS